MTDEKNRTHSRAAGPRTAEGKKIASQNSVKHGLLSKSLRFKDADEEAEFQKLFQDFLDMIQPMNRLEVLLVEDVAVSTWRDRVALAWAEREMRNRQSRTVEKTIHHFLGRSDALKMPLPGVDVPSGGAGSAEGAHSAGWDCKEMVLRLSSRELEQSGTAGISGSGKEAIADTSSEQYEIQLRMTDPIDTILRYENKLRRDRYRAIEYLLRIRELNRG